MSRVSPKTGEAVLPTPRGSMTPKRRAQVLLAYGGRCAKCGEKIMAPGWVANHILPLELGGADEIGNLEPLHATCDKLITAGPAGDLHRIAKTKRQAKLVGAREASKRPMRSRGFDKTKTRRFDGSVVERA